MFSVVVMPCRDEEEGLVQTCESLGFGSGQGVPDAHLVLVDNGSEDGTWDVMSAIRATSAAGSVTCVREPLHGHVQARRRGVEAARDFVADQSLQDGDVILVQADADTNYGPGYIASMLEASRSLGPGHLLEGRSVPPGPDQDRCAAFQALEAAVDQSLGPLLSFDASVDAIVDDKMVAYRLSDYLRWGGHLREQSRDGHEILAETTRLWLRARMAGASRSHVDDATAVTSQRRILTDPALAFATAGFPRDAGWVATWQREYRGARALEAFRPGGEADVEAAVRSRVVHMFAMFRVLPELLKGWDMHNPTQGGSGAGLSTVTWSHYSTGQLLERAFADASAVASGLMRGRPSNAQAGIDW